MEFEMVLVDMQGLMALDVLQAEFTMTTLCLWTDQAVDKP